MLLPSVMKYVSLVGGSEFAARRIPVIDCGVGNVRVSDPVSFPGLQLIERERLPSMALEATDVE
jgi:hypothetical protein